LAVRVYDFVSHFLVYSAISMTWNDDYAHYIILLRFNIMTIAVGEFETNKVYEGDCLQLVEKLPDEIVDVLVTSPPYWGQRTSLGMGTENDPREYLEFLNNVFCSFLPKLKKYGII